MVGQAYSFTPVATSPNGGVLQFSLDRKPGWASFDAATGRLSGTPGPADVGSYSLTITVNDGSASAAFPLAFAVVQVANGRATASWIAPTQRTDGTELRDLSGYRVYYGTSPTMLTARVEIANTTATSAVIENLTPGTWYFAATAVDAQGIESELSETGRKTIG